MGSVAGMGAGAGFWGARWTPASWGTDRVLDYTADDVLTSGGKTTAFVNQVAGGPNATQANAALQAAAPAAHAGLNGALAVYFTNSQYIIADVNDTSLSHAFTITVDNNDATTSSQYALDVQTGRIICALVGTVANEMGRYDSSLGWGGWATKSVTGAHRYLWSMSETDNKMYGFVDGVSAGAAINYVDKSLDSVGGFGGYCDGTGYRLSDCYVGHAVLLKRAWTAADETNYAAWSVGKYGV